MKSPRLLFSNQAAGHGLRLLTSCSNLIWMVLVAALLLPGCSPQIYSNLNHKQLTLSSDRLKVEGIAFITPSTVTGQEEEKQAVAFVFAAALKEERPDLTILSLPETLSAINKAGLAQDYELMYRDYKDTGVFKRNILQKISAATNTRYLAQLKLAGFNQGGTSRLGVFGLRLVETRRATLRLFFQIWDAENGEIAWEALQELNWSEEMVSEDIVTLQMIMAQAAKNIGARLPI
ncbi:hypothetical protein [Desulfogranum mediterraneum]|uniref:hypothetical protein n=1 Tax=Desulfogranum mediterraneum TaxID=160661 RepID=UPI00042604EB|nr:hypothetical protein [Desulfogranum mediterraneum]